MENMYGNGVVVASEFGILIVCYILVKGVFRLLLNLCRNTPLFKRSPAALEVFGKKINLLLGLLLLGLFLAVLGINGYFIYKRTDLMVQANMWLDRVSPEFWLNVAVGLLKGMALAVVAAIVIGRFHKLLMYLMERAKAFEQVKANDESIEIAFNALDRIQKKSLWLVVAILAAGFLHLPGSVPAALLIILKIYLCIAMGVLIVRAVTAVIDSLDAVSKKYCQGDNLLRYYDHFRELVPLLSRCLEYIIYVSMATLVTLQVEFIAKFAEYGPMVIQAIGIFFLSKMGIEVVYLVIDQISSRGKKKTEEVLQRHLTLTPLIKSFCKYMVYFIAFVLILNAFKLNPAPILAGAGILGVVVGLGAQPLINDLVSGFFIIFENLFLVGDFIETGTAAGLVEAIDIRTTRLRHPDGQLHILRNGQIGEIINHSKSYTHAVVEVGVAYDSDLDKVFKVLHDVGAEIKESNKNVLEPTQVCGLKNFGESELTIRTITKVKPGCHLAVAFDLRKRIKEAFDREGIEIPFAQRVVTFKDETSGNVVSV